MRSLNRLGTTLGLRLLPDLAGHALLFAFYWRLVTAPASLGAGAFDDAMAIWWFEFLFLHSFAFITLARSGIRFLWLTLPVYAFFALGVGTGFESTELMILFWWHLGASILAGWKPVADPENGRGGIDATRRRMRDRRRGMIEHWAGYAGSLAAFLLAIAAAGAVSGLGPELQAEEQVAVMGLIYFGLRTVASFVRFAMGERIDLLDIWERMEAADRAAKEGS